MSELTIARARLRLRPMQRHEAGDLQAAAQADGHEVLMPAYVIEDESGELVGGVGCLALVQVWTHTEKVKARDSVRLLAELEASLGQQGIPVICMPCTERSPYRPFMERLGYTFGWAADLFFKALNQGKEASA